MELYPEPWPFLTKEMNLKWAISKVHWPFSAGPSQMQSLLLPSSGDLPLCEAPHGEHTASPENATAVKCQELRKFFSFDSFSVLCVEPQCVLSS